MFTQVSNEWIANISVWRRLLVRIDFVKSQGQQTRELLKLYWLSGSWWQIGYGIPRSTCFLQLLVDLFFCWPRTMLGNHWFGVNKMLRWILAGLVFGLSSHGLAQCPELLQHSFRKLHSTESVNLCEAFGGKPLLIINTASNCGFTDQFAGLETLYQSYAEQGLAVLGFSSNDFFQEADEEADAAEVCYVNYGVTFTMFAPTSVRGKDANPVFKELADQAGAPRWNFTKYLVAPDGKVIGRFGSSVTPADAEIRVAIESLL